MRPFLPTEQGETDQGHQLAMNWANFVPSSSPAGGKSGTSSDRDHRDIHAVFTSDWT